MFIIVSQLSVPLVGCLHSLPRYLSSELTFPTKWDEHDKILSFCIGSTPKRDGFCLCHELKEVI